MRLRSRRVRQFLPFLAVLQRMRPEHRVIILSHLDDATRDQLYETIRYVLRSDRVPFRRRLFLHSKLADHQKDLCYLTDRSKTSALKKKRLLQMGSGALSHVLRVAVPALYHELQRP